MGYPWAVVKWWPIWIKQIFSSSKFWNCNRRKNPDRRKSFESQICWLKDFFLFSAMIKHWEMALQEIFQIPFNEWRTLNFGLIKNDQRFSGCWEEGADSGVIPMKVGPYCDLSSDVHKILFWLQRILKKMVYASDFREDNVAIAESYETTFTSIGSRTFIFVVINTPGNFETSRNPSKNLSLCKQIRFK